MELIIRTPELQDIPAMAALRRKIGVKENTLGLVTDSTAKSEAFFRGEVSGRHILVGELDGQLVGVVGLTIEQHPRLNHTASLGISVDSDFQGKGYGRELMEAIIDLSENWLMIYRLELGVITDNHRALKLYESLGFEREGIKRCSIKRDGRYVDEYIMSKLNPNLFLNNPLQRSINHAK